MRLRKIAAVSSISLALAGVAVLAPTAAIAASPDNAYTCKGQLVGVMPLENLPLTAVVDTNLGATSSAGLAGTGTITVTVPEDTAGLLYSLGGRSIQGEATVKTTANGAAVPFSGKTKVAAPAKGPLKATIKGAMKPITKLGATTIDAKAFSLKMVVTKVDKSSFTVVLNCSAAATAVTTVDTTNAVVAKTKTALKAKAAKGKVTLTAKVAGATTGKVKISVTGKKKVTKTVAVKDGKAVVTLKLKKGAYKATAAFVKSKIANASQSKKVSFKVK